VFHKSNQSKDGYQSRCKPCYIKAYKRHAPEKRRQRRDYHHKLRLKAFKVLRDPPECFHCFTDDFRILTFDHINNDGAEERKQLKGNRVARQINKMTKEEARSRYQILCHNCNYLRRLEQTALEVKERDELYKKEEY